MIKQGVLPQVDASATPVVKQHRILIPSTIHLASISHYRNLHMQSFILVLTLKVKDSRPTDRACYMGMVTTSDKSYVAASMGVRVQNAST
jgi:hypothetical protein